MAHMLIYRNIHNERGGQKNVGLLYQFQYSIRKMFECDFVAPDFILFHFFFLSFYSPLLHSLAFFVCAYAIHKYGSMMVVSGLWCMDMNNWTSREIHIWHLAMDKCILGQQQHQQTKEK